MKSSRFLTFEPTKMTRVQKTLYLWNKVLCFFTQSLDLSVCLSVCLCVCVCHQDCDKMAGLTNTVLSEAITTDNN